MNPSAKMMTSKAISPSLSQPPVPVQNFPQARPTLAGPANGIGGVMGTPAIVKQTFSLESTESGGVLSKKKLDELVRQVTTSGEGMGGETLTPEVEEVIRTAGFSSVITSC
jgi:transcription initiation factor TFIID subunit TAF12